MEQHEGDAPPVVTVTVPGALPYVDVLRSAAALVARLMGFSYDGIEDVSVVVDEACVLLLEAAPGTSRLKLEVQQLPESGRSMLQMSVVAEDRGENWDRRQLESDLGWQVLSSLAAEVDVLEGPPGFRIRQPAR